MNDEPTKRDYLIVLIVGLTLLIGCGLMLWINWNSVTVLGGIGRVFGGLLEFVGVSNYFYWHSTRAFSLFVWYNKWGGASSSILA